MRLPAMVLCLLGIAARLPAQDSLDTRQWIPLITYWDKGDTLRYQMVKGFKTYRDGNLTDSTGKRTEFSLIVIDSTATDYTVRYDLTSSNALQEYGLSENELLEIMKRYPNIAIDYRIDSLGSFLGFKDLGRLSQLYREIFNWMISQKIGVEQIEANKGFWERLASPEFFLKGMEHIQLMHQFYGVHYARDSVIEYQDQIANLWDTSRPFQIDMAIQVRKKPEWNGLAVLRQEYTLERETMQVLMESLKSHLPGIKFDESELERMHFEVAATYVFDPDYGYIYHIWYSRELFLEDERLRDDFIDLDIIH